MIKMMTFFISTIFCFEAIAKDHIMVCGEKNKSTWKLSEKKLLIRSMGTWVEYCKPDNKNLRYKNNSDGTLYYKLDLYKNSAVCDIKRHGLEYKNDNRLGIQTGHTAIVDFLLLHVTYENEGFFKEDPKETIRYECTKFDPNK